MQLAPPPRAPHTPPHAGSMPDTAARTIETRLWQEEHDWLIALQKRPHNVAPTFRLPDLISACVSCVFAERDAPARLFAFLGTTLLMRRPDMPRRRELMWTAQYDLLQDLQRSAANQHPHPRFQLDQFRKRVVQSSAVRSVVDGHEPLLSALAAALRPVVESPGFRPAVTALAARGREAA